MRKLDIGLLEHTLYERLRHYLGVDSFSLTELHNRTDLDFRDATGHIWYPMMFRWEKDPKRWFFIIDGLAVKNLTKAGHSAVEQALRDIVLKADREEAKKVAALVPGPVCDMMDDKFLAILTEAAKQYGSVNDWQEIQRFVRELHYRAKGVAPSGALFEPYEIRPDASDNEALLPGLSRD
jgi:hypothetical protein